MDDFSNPDRTWMCSILFLDIVNYSSQSVQLQMEWKRRFNRYLVTSLSDVPEPERVILDTGDGAAICSWRPGYSDGSSLEAAQFFYRRRACPAIRNAGPHGNQPGAGEAGAASTGARMRSGMASTQGSA